MNLFRFMGCFLCNNSKDDEVALKEKGTVINQDYRSPL